MQGDRSTICFWAFRAVLAGGSDGEWDESVQLTRLTGFAQLRKAGGVRSALEPAGRITRKSSPIRAAPVRIPILPEAFQIPYVLFLRGGPLPVGGVRTAVRTLSTAGFRIKESSAMRRFEMPMSPGTCKRASARAATCSNRPREISHCSSARSGMLKDALCTMRLDGWRWSTGRRRRRCYIDAVPAQPELHE